VVKKVVKAPPRRPGSARRATASDLHKRSIPESLSGVAAALSPPGFSTKHLMAELTLLRARVESLETENANLKLREIGGGGGGGDDSSERMEELEAENERLQNENDELLLEMELLTEGVESLEAAALPSRGGVSHDFAPGLIEAMAATTSTGEGRSRASLSYQRAQDSMPGSTPRLTITVIKKHKVRGKYTRDFAVFDDRIATLNPKDGKVTNAWDLDNIIVSSVHVGWCLGCWKRVAPREMHFVLVSQRSTTPPPYHLSVRPSAPAPVWSPHTLPARPSAYSLLARSHSLLARPPLPFLFQTVSNSSSSDRLFKIVVKVPGKLSLKKQMKMSFICKTSEMCSSMVAEIQLVLRSRGSKSSSP
jgi:cell division protein FtsB